MSFKQIGLPQWLCETLSGVSITTPTRIQVATIPEILAGKDCIGGAATGSGKTLCFAGPILAKWAQDPMGIYAVVLTPTRELALQIGDQFAAMGSNVNLKSAVVIGGEPLIEQANKIKENPDVIIATPGRLAHLIAEHPQDVRGLKRVKFLVMDEADRLLTDSFTNDLATCVGALPLPQKRQTLLFTATVTDAVRSLQEKKPAGEVVLHELDKIDNVVVPERLTLQYVLTPVAIKESLIVSLLTNEQFKDSTVMLFVNRSHTCEYIKRMLMNCRIRVTSLHSEMPQTERTNSLHRFRAGAARVLVSTDLGGRGLDIPSVELVVNYDLPQDPDDFVHRVGRTGRAGRKGISISVLTPNDLDRVLAIEERVNRKMDEYQDDSLADDKIQANMKLVTNAKVDARMSMDKDGFGDRRKQLKHKEAIRAKQGKRAAKAAAKSSKSLL